MARASESEQTGSVGVSEVTGKFGRIGFGFAEITRHDNGTDVFLMARDSRRFDLGLTMGAQIKGGESWFKEPKLDSNGSPVGWWFRDDDGSHIDDWLQHGLPHLLVLHNLETDTSYWVHVTHEAVTSTGKGKKILVPAEQKVDEDSRETLIAIAAINRPAPGWEGSAWRGAESVLERDLLRYALVVPRLVAPHPNMRLENQLSPYQAVALTMQARISELADYARCGQVPKAVDAAISPEWPWQFYAALHTRVTTGEVDHLAAMRDDAPDSAAATVATVAAAACLMEENRPGEAVELLETERTADRAEPVDHAWLCVQLARACAEIGLVDDAKQLAGSVQGIAATHSEDVTATAIAGVGARLLFSVTDWGTGDLGRAIEASDTAASWWRQQTCGWALGDSLERTFIDWSRDTSFRVIVNDQARNYLVAAGLNATLTGDHGGWRHLSGLLGRDSLIRLTRTSDVKEVRAGLSTLRLAGDHNALKKATRRVVEDGPATAATEVARAIDLSASTHSTAHANLTLLAESGGVLDQETADATTAWLLRTLVNPAAFEQRVRPTFHLADSLLNTLADVLQSASPDAHREIVDYLLDLSPITDELLARRLSNVIDHVRRDAWDSESVTALAARAAEHHETLRDALLGAAHPHVEAAREFLLAEIAAGSSSALGAWGDVRTLPAEVVAGMIDHLVGRLATRRETAAKGSIPGYAYDDPSTLAMLNRWHPDHAQWNPLVEYLADDNVIADQKRRTLFTMASSLNQVSDELRERVIAVALRIYSADDHRDAGMTPWLGATGPAAYLIASAQESAEIDNSLVELLSGSNEQRRWAARIAGETAATSDTLVAPTGLLIALAVDADVQVRATAAAGLTSLVIRGSDHPAVTAAVKVALADGGLRVPLAIARRIAAATELSPASELLRVNLLRHHFVPVRDAISSE